MLERLTTDMQAALDELGLEAAEVRLMAESDLGLDGRYGGGWVLATGERLITRAQAVAAQADPGSGATAAAAQADRGNGATAAVAEPSRLQTYPLASVSELKAENLVAGGMLTAQVDGESHVLARFSGVLVKTFSEFARAFEKLSEGKAFTPVLAAEESHCPTCGRHYPNQDRKVCPWCIDRRSLFKRVLGFLTPYRAQVALIAVLMIASSGFRAATPILGGRVLFDDVLTPGGRFHGQLLLVLGALLLAHIAAGLTQAVYGRINAKLSARLIYDLKSQIFAAMQRLSLSFYNKQETGGLMVRVNHDAMHLQFFFIDGLPFFVVNALLILAVGGALLWLNWTLALLVFVPVPLIVIVVRTLFPRLWRLFSRYFRSRAVMNTVVNDSLTGVRVVKAFGKEREEIERFLPTSAKVYEAGYATRRVSATVFPLIAFLTQVGGLIVWAVGGWRVVGGSLSFGTLMSFIGFLAMLYEPLRFMTQVVEWWSSSMNSAQRIFEILDTTPDVTDHQQAQRLPALRGDVTLEHVTFAYEPNKPVLHDISLHIEAGQMVGLVGHTGAGKSTLTNIVTRLYDVDEGQVRIDGIDVRRIAQADLRAQIGIILQEPYLFHGSVIENIAYARPDATREELIAAARVAYAHDFIVQLPAGYDTLIGPKGHDLSGGEKQRIAFARAALRDPRILILDEATSSLDSETEQKIQAALEHLARGRTTIAIAHRLSTLRGADRLFVLEKGHLVEEGTHAELLAARGVFHRLVEKQRKALQVIGIGEDRPGEETHGG